jgi:anti-sigma regulatory factor (Ser/Thr protein kinase)
MPDHRAYSTSIELAPGPIAPRHARELVRQALPDCEPRIVDRAMLLASELVTNAVIHAATPLALELSIHDDLLHVLVEDRNGQLPVIVEERGAQGGFGLHIVERLADAWGSAPRDDGKAVWFSMALHTRDRSSRRDDGARLHGAVG